MRRWGWIVGLVVLLAAGYWAWPLVGAARLAGAVERGDAAEVMARTDMPALRRSLARQIASAYLDVTGRGNKMGALGRSFAGAAVTTVADPYLAELLTPENITAMLRQGKVNQVKVGDQVMATARDIPHVSDLFRSNAMSVLFGSYFDGIASFVVPVNAEAAPEDAYRIHLRLDGATWRLSGLDFPPALVGDLARSILAKNDAPAP